jgi:hypothetical protein
VKGDSLSRWRKGIDLQAMILASDVLMELLNSTSVIVGSCENGGLFRGDFLITARKSSRQDASIAMISNKLTVDKLV